MRAIFAQSLPENPWLLGAFLGVLALFGTVLLFSLGPWRSRTLDDESRLPLND